VWLRHRSDDVIVLNETWEKTTEERSAAHPKWVNGKLSDIPEYTCHSKARCGKRGGGVAILLKNHLGSHLIPSSVKDTLIVKVLVGRSRYLHLITSYLPCGSEYKWMKRWEKIRQELLMHCSETNLNNIVIAADWNKNLEESQTMAEQFHDLGLQTAEDRYDWTFSCGNKRSKLDFFVLSKNLQHKAAISHRSLSDHALIALEIREVSEIKKNKIRILDRRLARTTTSHAIEKMTCINDFFKTFKRTLASRKTIRWA